MRELGFILQKRSYWCALFALIGLLLIFLAWNWAYKDVFGQRASLVSSYSTYHQQANAKQLESSVNDSLIAATNEVSEIREKLSYQSEVRNSAEIIPFVVKALDGISEKYNVKLKGVKPMAPEVVLMLEERPFDITISGEYKNLFAWVTEAEDSLSPMGIKSFQLRPGGADEGVEMWVRVVSYRLPGEQQ